MELIIDAQRLCKEFSGFKAVSDLSFQVFRGDVYGFLGQNGAGKSTTIRMLLTLIRPTSGSIHMFGKDVSLHRNHVLRQTGAVIERPDLYRYLTAAENLSCFARLNGLRLSRIQILDKLRQVGLAERADSPVKTFSQGMKQRLGIAVALVHDPDLVILDEPTNGLDPQGIADMRQLILSLSRDLGKTVLVSSHLLSEIEQIATRMIILDKGRKMVEGTVAELLDPANTLLECQTTDPEGTWNWLEQTEWASHRIESRQGLIRLRLPRTHIPLFSRAVADAGFDLTTLQYRNSLEDYFLTLTGAQENG